MPQGSDPGPWRGRLRPARAELAAEERAAAPLPVSAGVRRRGFTLLEMVVVLAILAVVTAVATRELVRGQDQHRFAASQRGLEELRAAILGAPAIRALDGTPLLTGFVADMGRYPTSLAELWTNITGTAFALRAADDDAEVLLAGGRRGPYVRLPIGASSLKDGWGREFLFSKAGDDIEFGHYGSDGTNSTSTSGYNRDIAVHCSAEEAAASLYGQVLVDTNVLSGIASYSISVLVFGPDPSGGLRESPATVGNPSTNGGVVSRSWIAGTDALATIGPRAVRAYLDTASSVTNKSTVMYLTLRSGLNGPVILRID
jgi:prepilin-type N-terminal cleavage/methylation domain-containing protein